MEGKKKKSRKVFIQEIIQVFSILHLKPSCLVLCWYMLGFFPHHLDGGFYAVQGHSLEMKRKRTSLF